MDRHWKKLHKTWRNGSVGKPLAKTTGEWQACICIIFLQRSNYLIVSIFPAQSRFKSRSLNSTNCFARVSYRFFIETSHMQFYPTALKENLLSPLSWMSYK